MDMYICAPWGNYELELVFKSTKGGNAMEKIAWEVEYGPDEGNYSVMYSGPFPPLECSNLHPSGITYERWYSVGIFGTADGPTGSANYHAENYHMFDGIDDDGVNADKVTTLEKCAATCTARGTQYFGREFAVKPYRQRLRRRGLRVRIDITFGGDAPDYKCLCSGDSRVLCGTDDHISVYSLDGRTGGGDDDSGNPPVDSEFIGCVADKP
ncbi:unnamed protein product [Ectocarpus sp. CCAP 1310/34]|nr:unnamed protein product [Ectocarpus sp. CCAP 1310/34]